MNEQPLISIVVPSFNQGRYIEQTITSVLGQSYANKELIVIDGGSTDETREVVERYAGQIAHFVSEKDSGQSGAINKGMRVARGDIVAWLNSDDMYLPCAFEKAVKAIGDVRQPRLIYGASLNLHDGKPSSKGFWPKPFDAQRLRHRDYMNQPASFWTRALWEKTGELNEALNFVMDWDWFIRATAHCDFTLVEDYFAIYRFHAAHKTDTGSNRRNREIVAIVEKYADAGWAEVYRDVERDFARIVRWRERLKNTPFYRLRRFFLPHVYRHGTERVECALHQLIAHTWHP